MMVEVFDAVIAERAVLCEHIFPSDHLADAAVFYLTVQIQTKWLAASVGERNLVLDLLYSLNFIKVALGVFVWVPWRETRALHDGKEEEKIVAD